MQAGEREFGLNRSVLAGLILWLFGILCGSSARIRGERDVRVAETTVLHLSRLLYHPRIGSRPSVEIAPFVRLEAGGLPRQGPS